MKRDKSMKLRYQRARAEDLEAVYELVGNAIREMCSKGILQWDELYPDKDILREDIQKKELYMGKVGESIAVIYVLNNDFDEEYQDGNWKEPDKSFCVLHRLCVNPLFQNAGIAKKTMQQIEKQVVELGFEAIRFDAFLQNPYALKLYASLGYEKVGEIALRKGKFCLFEKYFRNDK